MDTKITAMREQIILSSQNVFQKVGYSNVTMANIAEASQMGRSSLYYYFKNKSEVFEAMASYLFKIILEKSEKEIKPTQSFHDNFLKFNSVRLKLMTEQMSHYQNLLLDLRENPGILTCVKNSTFEWEVSIFRKMLGWAITNGDIAPLSADDLNFLSNNLLYAFRALEQELFLYGKVEDLTSRLSWVTQILNKGLK